MKAIPFSHGRPAGRQCRRPSRQGDTPTYASVRRPAGRTPPLVRAGLYDPERNLLAAGWIGMALLIGLVLTVLANLNLLR